MKKTETENFKTSKNPAGAFASQYVASRLDLQTGQEFPMDIWQKMGKAGLFKIGIDRMYGGDG
ncbi:MAG TPA: acyl-CoA dehydrogenase family protein, partial [Smithellaceae bacterium]|nr:acyl-CoA dehydrogenase family protein [Smithellaceae bacterium]